MRRGFFDVILPASILGVGQSSTRYLAIAVYLFDVHTFSERRIGWTFMPVCFKGDKAGSYHPFVYRNRE